MRWIVAGAIAAVLTVSAAGVVAAPTKSWEERLTTALTGRLDSPITIRVTYARDDEHPWRFSFADGRGWHEGHRQWEDGMPFSVLLVDVNFDGVTDLWVTRCADGQCRATLSDVWLFDATSRGFIHSDELSDLQNLAVDPERKLIRAGLTNCGCAAYCYDVTLYRIVKNRLQPVARHEADCTRYREYALVDGTLQKTREQDEILLDYFVGEITPLDIRRGWDPGLPADEREERRKSKGDPRPSAEPSPSCSLELHVEPANVTLRSLGRVSFQGTLIRAFLRNSGVSVLTLIDAGDGSGAGRRTPILSWVPESAGARWGWECGNINALRPSEVFDLGPGESREIDLGWGPALTGQPGVYEVRLRYENAPDLEWSGIPLGQHDEEAMRRVRRSSRCVVLSNSVVVTVVAGAAAAKMP